MKCFLQRRPSAADWMFGDFYADAEWQCHTLEDELRENKVAAETAIPSGRYRLTLEDSPKFGPRTITINNVPGFTSIRIHGGTSDEDSSGCPIVGDSIYEDTGRISGAMKHGVLDALKLKISEAIIRGEEVWLEIRNAPDSRYVDSGNPATA